MKAAKKGQDKLDELNDALVPVLAAAPAASTTTTTVAEGLIPRPPAIPPPSERDRHNKTHVTVGRCTIGDNPGTVKPLIKLRGMDKKQRIRRCKRCKDNKMYDANIEHDCAGAGGNKRECDYFDKHNGRRCWRCFTHGINLNPYTCQATKGNPWEGCRDDCTFFGPSVKGKCQSKT